MRQGAVLFELIQLGKRKPAVDLGGLRSPSHVGVITGSGVHAGAIQSRAGGIGEIEGLK